MTALPTSYAPISIDYTSRDYYAIREQLIARVQDRLPNWTGNNEADFGLALVEAFSYLGDLISYYIDRNANEAFLSTATQRDSIINLAETYGYTPAGYRSATVPVQFVNTETASTVSVASASGNGTTITYVATNDFSVGALVTVTGFTTTALNVSGATITAASPTSFAVANSFSGASGGSESGSATMSPVAITLLAGTVVSGEVTVGDTVQTVYFTILTDAVADPAVANGLVEVTAVHGQSVTLVSSNANTYGELIGYGDANSLPNQTYQLNESPSADNTVNTPVTVYVQDGDSYSTWTQVQHLVDYGPTDQVFSLFSDANNNVFVQFGNGISGLIPVPFSEIRVVYTVGGGTIGNILPQTLNTIEYSPGYTTNQLSYVKNVITIQQPDLGTGGTDPESVALIKAIAPVYLRANTRAVTLADFNSLALGVTGVGKANAVASTWTSVTLYIAPSRDINTTDLQPGLNADGSPANEYTTLSATVQSALTPNLLIGSSLTIQPPTYIDVILALQYTANPQYTHSQVEAAIKSMLVSTYGYFNNNFADTIHKEDIEGACNALPQVRVATVTVLHAAGGSGLVTPLVGTAGQIFRFQEGNISLGSS